jgi:thiamine biosynthesis lipoprotein
LQLQLANGAVAKSGSYIHKIDNQDKFLDHHIINPSTGRSVDGVISSTVLTPTCVDVDTTATVLMNVSAKEGKVYLDKHDLFGVIVDKNGKSFLSKKAFRSFGIETKDGPRF